MIDDDDEGDVIKKHDGCNFIARASRAMRLGRIVSLSSPRRSMTAVRTIVMVVKEEMKQDPI